MAYKVALERRGGYAGGYPVEREGGPMVMIRVLTPEEIEQVLTAGKRRGGMSPSPQLIAIRAMQLGDGILLSHEGLTCSYTQTSIKRKCSLDQILSRARKSSPYGYKCSHTNGQGSDVMIVCFAKPVPPADGGQE